VSEGLPSEFELDSGRRRHGPSLALFTDVCKDLLAQRRGRSARLSLLVTPVRDRGDGVHARHLETGAPSSDLPSLGSCVDAERAPATNGTSTK
jgi:hypothetical protein